MNPSDRSHLKFFGLSLAGTWVFAMFLPVDRWPYLALGTLSAGLAMLGIAWLNTKGIAMKGTADPKSVASGALGLLLGTVLIYFFSR
ncbi:MAG TPA: hypothetical protein PLT09_05895 [Deltaproteobacteria bacterium]|nr:hypothetical protein [Deltaproteobacteria bacterium]HPR56505.1 hypothetical protein [Deltaproteobacteria bacterium]HXK46951.1 hypothetical protein [Deltaproteobacteria bacterium]